MLILNQIRKTYLIALILVIKSFIISMLSISIIINILPNGIEKPSFFKNIVKVKNQFCEVYLRLYKALFSKLIQLLPFF